MAMREADGGNSTASYLAGITDVRRRDPSEASFWELVIPAWPSSRHLVLGSNDWQRVSGYSAHAYMHVEPLTVNYI